LHEQNRVPELALLTSLFEQMDKRAHDTFTVPRRAQAAGRIHLDEIVAGKVFGVKPHIGSRVGLALICAPRVPVGNSENYRVCRSQPADFAQVPVRRESADFSAEVAAIPSRKPLH
jgi:hypothetical protein